MQMCGEYPQVRVALLKALEILIQGNLCLLSDLRSRARVILVPDLDHQLVKGLLLFTGPDLLIIVIDLSVRPRLFGIVSFESFIEQFMVDLFEWFIKVIDIELGTGRIHISCFELPAVMIDRPLAHLGTDRSLHSSHILPQMAFVTFCESNAKALLTACGHQKMLLRPPEGKEPPL